MAKWPPQKELTLAVEHWEVVRFVREFYLEFNTSPAIRAAGQGDGQQVWRRERQQPLSLSPVPGKDPPNRRLKSPACRSRVKCIYEDREFVPQLRVG